MMGTGAVWAVAGYIIAEMIQFVTIGRRLRVQGENTDYHGKKKCQQEDGKGQRMGQFFIELHHGFLLVLEI